MTEPYYCKDCGQRFFNLGWHAESCGSSNFERLSDYWERLDKLRRQKELVKEPNDERDQERIEH